MLQEGLEEKSFLEKVCRRTHFEDALDLVDLGCGLGEIPA